jgi:4-amino-4-deoxy-L-arabinose transferase-like glycosyltransferase
LFSCLDDRATNNATYKKMQWIAQLRTTDSRSAVHVRLDSTWKISLLLFLSALLVNLIAAFLLRSHATIGTIDRDEQEYWGLAGRILENGIHSIPARRTFPFPLAIAGLRRVVGDHYLQVQMALSAVISISPVLLYWIVNRRFADERVARLSAVIALVWPPFVRYGATIYSDSLALMTFLIFLLAFPLPAAIEAHVMIRWRQWCFAGAMLGICILMKPLYILYAPIGFLLAVYSERRRSRRVLAGFVLTLGCLVVVLPWSAYLSNREGQFILTSANYGETLAGGLNPALLAMRGDERYITPGGRATWIGPGKWVNANETGYLSASDLQLPYTQQSKLLSQRSRTWISAHPGDVVYLSVRKIMYMWGVYPFWNGVSQSVLGNFPLLLLVAAAAVALRRRWDVASNLALFWTLPIFSTIVALISWGSWRFRMPADIGIIVLAASLLVAVKQKAPDKCAIRPKMA